MTKEELNKLIILNTNIKTGEPLFFWFHIRTCLKLFMKKVIQ
jgi:hypothetical protein